MSPPICFVTGAMRELELVAVGELDGLRRDAWRQAGGVGGEVVSLPWVAAPSSDVSCGGLRALGDPLGDERGVVLHPAEQRGAARVLPRKAEEVEAGDVGDAAPMDERPSSSVIGRSIQEWSKR